MNKTYLTVLRATGESDVGQVAKAGKWAADEIEAQKSRMNRLTRMLTGAQSLLAHHGIGVETDG